MVLEMGNKKNKFFLEIRDMKSTGPNQTRKSM